MATEMEQLSTWLPPAEALALRDVATRERRSVSMMIRLIVEAYLQSNGPVAPSEQGTGSRAATEGA